MSVEISLGSGTVFPEDDSMGLIMPRQSDHRAEPIPVGLENRVSAGQIEDDMEQQLRLVQVLDCDLPAYLLLQAMDDTPSVSIGNAIVSNPERHDKYQLFKFREDEEPELAHDAWRIHAEGYHAMGFVKDSALTPEGYLEDGIDHSQGSNTDYFLAVNPDNDSDRATMRVINLPVGGTYEDLPAYQACKETLNPRGVQLLASIPQVDMRLKEIAAMSRTASASPVAVHELIREVFQESLGKSEVLFFSIVSTTFESLTKTMGQESFTIIGDDAPIHDPRVNENIALRPALFYPDAFLDTLCKSYANANSPQDKARLRRSILFFTEGLGADQMSSAVQQARQEITAA